MKVLIIGDTQTPWMHKNYIKFLCHERDKYNPDVIVHIGDAIDNYSFSRYQKNPDAISAEQEYENTMYQMERLYREFPDVKLILGNHDLRIARKAEEAGLTKRQIRPIEEVYCMPNGWEVARSFVIDDVYYFHGEKNGGQSGWQNYCLRQCQSSVAGHAHSTAGVRYHQLRDDIQIFSMQVGCGMDENSLGASYAIGTQGRGVLGLGTVTDGWDAQFRLMNMRDRTYRRIR